MTMPSAVGSLPPRPPSVGDRRFIQEYDKIVQFRDDVLHGVHPRVKILPHLVKQPQLQQKSPQHEGQTPKHAMNPPPNSGRQAHQNNSSASHAVNSMTAVTAFGGSRGSGDIGAAAAGTSGASGGGRSGDTIVAAGSASSISAPAPSVGQLAKPVNSHESANRVPSGRSALAIDPIFLEKSEDLKKAEIQLQRQRIERQLKEDVEQSRGKHQNGDQIIDFDLSEVLMKAVERVHMSTPVPPKSTGDQSPESDSFDELYSSQDETTPEFRQQPPPSSGPARPDTKGSAAISNRDAPIVIGIDIDDDDDDDDQYEPPEPTRPADTAPRPTHAAAAPTQVSAPRSQLPIQAPEPHKGRVIMKGAPLSTIPPRFRLDPNAPSGDDTPRPSISSRFQPGPDASSSGDSAVASRSRDSDSNGTDQISAHSGRQNRGSQALAPPFEPGAPSRPHNSPPSSHYMSGAITLTPGQQSATEKRGSAVSKVSAMRNGAGQGTSPENSPQADKKKQKKDKKKKRKAAERAQQDLMPSPYIKPEPMSVSPPIPPASKRRRQSGSGQAQENRLADGADGAASRYERVDVIPQDPYAPRPQREGYIMAYENAPRPQSRQSGPIVLDSPRMDQEFYDDRRSVVAPAPPMYARQYSDSRPPQPVTYYTSQPPPQQPQPPPQQPQPQYREAAPTEPGRMAMSVHPEASRNRSRSPTMGPPRAPMRVVVDQYGREYIEPPPPSMSSVSGRQPTVIRHSMAPISRQPEDNVVYERPASRAISRRPDVYEEGGVVYRRASSSFGAPPSRRVITQPEYVQQPELQRAYRERDYPTRPASSRRDDEFVTYRPVEYTRLQTAQPEMQLREYPPANMERVPSIQAERGRSVAPHAIGRGEYDMRPGEARVVHQEYMRPVEDARYYERQPQQQPQMVRRGEEISFIERPHGATQEIVYADDVRREVYR